VNKDEKETQQNFTRNWGQIQHTKISAGKRQIMKFSQ